MKYVKSSIILRRVLYLYLWLKHKRSILIDILINI